MTSFRLFILASCLLFVQAAQAGKHSFPRNYPQAKFERPGSDGRACSSPGIGCPGINEWRLGDERDFQLLPKSGY